MSFSTPHFAVAIPAVLFALACNRGEEAQTASTAEPVQVAAASELQGEQPNVKAALDESVRDATVTVYKSPTCGCCGKWEDHLRAHGFTVESKPTEDVQAVKATLGVPEPLRSCHTAVVGGYVIEGHAPADDIARLLRERPEIAGLAVPGMPLGSPGMEAPSPESYDVVAFDRNGETSVFAKH